MTDKVLLDEHLPRWWPRGIQQHQPDLMVWCVNDYGAPPLGSPDPALLEWCEQHHFLLVTNNRSSMPGHLAAHLGRGRHVPGILIVSLAIPIPTLAEQLALIAFASFSGEFDDQIRRLPL